MLSYALVTPARNEAANLERLAASLERQTVEPAAWVIVDDRSDDETFSTASALAERLHWARALRSSIDDRVSGRGQGREAVAFSFGVASIDPLPGVIVKLDADVSFEPDFFELLIARFEADPSLGIASGLCYELEGGVWTPRPMTRGHARGATRAYRRACFEQVTPFVQHLGWDRVDELKAQVQGWRTKSFEDLPFLHHRVLGTRDGVRREWISQGKTSYFLGYRPSYLLCRAAFRALRDPSALGLLWGFASASFHRARRVEDPAIIAHLREEQRFRHVLSRAREAAANLKNPALR